jgi:hypothetical protein
MHSATVHDLSNVAHICDESQILHAAASILRRQICDITISEDEYPAPEEVHPDLAVVVLLSTHQNVFLISVVVCVMCIFPFDQRQKFRKNSFSSWVKVNIFL